VGWEGRESANRRKVEHVHFLRGRWFGSARDACRVGLYTETTEERKRKGTTPPDLKTNPLLRGSLLKPKKKARSTGWKKSEVLTGNKVPRPFWKIRLIRWPGKDHKRQNSPENNPTKNGYK